MNNKEITSLSDAINIVKWDSGRLSTLNTGIKDYKEKFPYGTWFRGQEDSSWPLVASIFRRDDQENLLYAANEPHLVKNFRLRSALEYNKFTTTLDWLCLMQHHKCPTRLID